MSYEIACTIKHETDNAILIIDPADDSEHWIPLSQVEKITRDKYGQGTVKMTDWIAKQKGFL